MKISILFFIGIIAFAAYSCNNPDKSSPVENTITEKNDTPKTLDTLAKQDFHTTYTDVIENLFLFVNARDWLSANRFYEDPADMNRNSLYFRNLFRVQKIKRFSIDTIGKADFRVFVRANAMLRDSTAKEICFLFSLNEKNRIIVQRVVNCTSKILK
jgi:hypothetical protein